MLVTSDDQVQQGSKDLGGGSECYPGVGSENPG